MSQLIAGVFDVYIDVVVVDICLLFVVMFWWWWSRQ